MAEFCRQCSEKIFGEDVKDLAGLSKPEDTELDRFVGVLCEGCGFVCVDHEGTCTGGDGCRRHHKYVKPPYKKT